MGGTVKRGPVDPSRERLHGRAEPVDRAHGAREEEQSATLGRGRAKCCASRRTRSLENHHTNIPSSESDRIATPLSARRNEISYTSPYYRARSTCACCATEETPI